ncbi:hypothetical protein J3F83DRAFT_742691 [Trichoderma novae-zelandiae]
MRIPSQALSFFPLLFTCTSYITKLGIFFFLISLTGCSGHAMDHRFHICLVVHDALDHHGMHYLHEDVISGRTGRHTYLTAGPHCATFAYSCSRPRLR